MTNPNNVPHGVWEKCRDCMAQLLFSSAFPLINLIYIITCDILSNGAEPHSTTLMAVPEASYYRLNWSDMQNHSYYNHA